MNSKRDRDRRKKIFSGFPHLTHHNLISSQTWRVLLSGISAMTAEKENIFEQDLVFFYWRWTNRRNAILKLAWKVRSSNWYGPTIVFNTILFRMQYSHFHMDLLSWLRNLNGFFSLQFHNKPHWFWPKQRKTCPHRNLRTITITSESEFRVWIKE